VRRQLAMAAAAAVTGGLVLPVVASSAVSAATLDVNRGVEVVIMTGQQFPNWSRLPAQGAANPIPSTSSTLRDAHNGQLVVSPDPGGRAGVTASEITAFRWTAKGWKEVPVQVDQRFPYFLVNMRSSFGIYSQTDEELTYQWDQEAWKKVSGQCNATYDPSQDPSSMKGDPTLDPVPGFDDDDELSFHASDAGSQAPADARAPKGTLIADSSQPGFQPRQEIALRDPVTGAISYVYLFLTSQGSSFGATNGYVRYQRDANADQWIDHDSFAASDPEKLGSSNTGYGPNLQGTVCDPDGTVRQSTDRFPRDGMTVATPTYRLHATGRWMVRTTEVTRQGTTASYGPDLVDRWKGRAFQQSPDSNISVVGFEDEQVNWEANSALLGERYGPVRAIREVWGADSGTNVTKLEYYYRDGYVFRYHLRVHPIPPDGLYTSWDHNVGAVTTYYDEGMTTAGRPDGVAIDGQNDDVGNIDSNPVTGNGYFDVTDPTFSAPLAFYDWEEVSGSNGSLVYMFQLNDIKDVENPAITPYYRDDSCFDDGTGDDPSPRQYPGDAYTDMEASSDPNAVAYTQRPCYGDPSNGSQYSMSGPWRQGCIACHGIHYLFTNDTDNAFMTKPTTEVDGQQYIWAVPTNAAQNVGDAYADTVKLALVPTVSSQPSSAPKQQPSIANSGATAGEIANRVSLTAHLTDQGGSPLSNRVVRFSIDGTEVGTATTDAKGDASLGWTVQGPARRAQLTEAFDGDADFEPAEATVPFDVKLDATSLALAQAKVKAGIQATATLTDTDTTEPVAGRNVAFSVNGKTVGTATTGANGQAGMLLTKTKKGDRVVASFAGDAGYGPSSATRTI
jgi:hypothetical protein